MEWCKILPNAQLSFCPPGEPILRLLNFRVFPMSQCPEKVPRKPPRQEDFDFDLLNEKDMAFMLGMHVGSLFGPNLPALIQIRVGLVSDTQISVGLVSD